MLPVVAGGNFLWSGRDQDCYVIHEKVYQSVSFSTATQELKFSVYSVVKHAYITCILLDNNWEITKLVVARSKFLVSFISVGVNCEKVVLCVLFAVFLFLRHSIPILSAVQIKVQYSTDKSTIQ